MSILQSLGTESVLNGVAAGTKMSVAVLDNIYQGIVEPNGKGVTDKYTASPDVLQNARIIVTRVLPIDHDVREQGANKDGGPFSGEASTYPETEQQYVDCLLIDDRPFIIPKVTQDRIPVDLLAKHLENWTKSFNTIINGVTLAYKFSKTFLAEAGGETINKTSFDLATDDWLNALQASHTLLGFEGDIAHGIQAFPEEGLLFLLKGTYRTSLLKKGILLVGGANYAYDIARSGALDAASQIDKLGSGFAGIVDGVETHLAAAQTFYFADRYLGFPSGTLVASEFVGYCSSDIANSRGIALSDNFKIIDAQEGQGIKVQPYARIGCASWYAKGNSMLVGSNFNNFYTWLKTIWASGVTWGVKAYKSRLFPVGSIGSIATTGFTATFAANDDASVDHINATLAYFQADAAVTELSAFVAGYKAATVKNTATNGTAKSVTLTTGKYLNVLAVADDGSLTIASKIVP